MNHAAGSDIPPLKGIERFLATSAVLIASFMNVLDTTIAVVALPSIAGGLAATPSQGSWVLTIYSVCLAVVLPLSGWVSKRVGQIRAFYSAVFLFTLTSWLCAQATSFDELLIFRAFQGMSGGLLLPFSQSIILRIYPPEEHGKALGLWGITAAVAPVAGPLLGGYITDHFGWPWIFYINVPLGIFSFWACRTFLRRYETEIKRDPVDIIGLLLMVVGIISMQLALDRGHELDWLASMEVRVLIAVGVVSLIIFFIWELDEPHPIVDLSLFKNRNFALGSAMTAVFYGAFVVTAVMYPLWMQTSMGYTSSAAGLVMATTSIFPILAMPILGQRMRTWNPRYTITFGCCLMVIVMMLHGLLTPQVSSNYLAGVRFMIGFSMPFLWIPMMMITLIGLPVHMMDTATGLSNFIRMLASSLATAIGVTLWDDRTVVHRADIVEGLSRPSVERGEFLAQLSSGTGDIASGLAATEQMIAQQARTMAQQDVFMVCAGLILVVALLAQALPARRGPPPESHGAHPID